MKLPLYALTTALVLAVSTPKVLAAASKDEAAVRDHCATFIAAWNKHDAKAMAATWAEDGTLINPFGRIGNSRAEVEKILTLEHSTVMKTSTYKAEIVTVKFVEPNVAVTDWDSEITGMTDPKGAALPPFKHRVCIIVVKKDGKWSTAAARAFADLPPPPPSP
ncbi:MAG TPA: SgcJ/EcaC family oxidoreductase [Candidatus Didemnitutus sp.]|nr:SgcJ/EcaC family oxidoreductase [Candidatus Didemnitutus sp.]